MKLQSFIYTLLLSVLSIYSSFGETYVVDKTHPFDDTGTQYTLQEAIEKANSNPGFDIIEFDSKFEDVEYVTISSENDLRLTDPDGLEINGDLDGDGLPNITLEFFFGAVAPPTSTQQNRIQAVSEAYGLFIETGSNNNIIQGLHFNNNSGMTSYALVIAEGSTKNRIENCFFGVYNDGSGANTQGSELGGIYIEGAKNTIYSNLIGGFSTKSGITVSGSNAQGNVIIGNIIGVNLDRSEPIANKFGIVIENGASNTTIGDIGIDEENIIGSNNIGILIIDAIQTSIYNNYIGTDPNNKNLKNTTGISVEEVSQDTQIGQGDESHGNIISYNSTGLYVPLETDKRPINTQILHNFFGTDKNGNFNQGNDIALDIQGNADATIEKNIIGNSKDKGISLFNSNENTIYANTFFNNKDNNHIKLFENSNNKNEPPKITKQSGYTVEGIGVPNARIQVYVGPADFKGYLKDVFVDASGEWKITFDPIELDGESQVSFLQDLKETSSYSNTSEFSPSACVGLDVIEFTVGDEMVICGYEGQLQIHDKTDPTKHIEDEFDVQMNSKNSNLSAFNSPIGGENNIWTVNSMSSIDEYVVDTMIVTVSTIDGVCSITDSVKIEMESKQVFIQYPFSPYVTEDPDTTLSLNAYDSQIATLSNVWSVLDNGNATFAGNNGENHTGYPSYEIDVTLETGDNKFLFTQTTDLCTYTDTITYIYLEPTSSGVDAGNNLVTCTQDGTIQLDGSYPGSTETGKWTIKGSPTNLNFYSNAQKYSQNPQNDPKATLNGLNTSSKESYTLYWEISNQEGIPKYKDSVVIDNRPVFYGEPSYIDVCEDSHQLNASFTPGNYDDFTFTWKDEPTTGDLSFENQTHTANNIDALVKGIQEGNEYTVALIGELEQCKIAKIYKITRQKTYIIYAGFDTLIIPNESKSQLVDIDRDDTEGLIEIKPLNESHSYDIKHINGGSNEYVDWRYNIGNLPVGQSDFRINDIEVEGCLVLDTFSIVRRIITTPLKDQKVCGPTFDVKAEKLLAGQTGQWSISNQPSGANAQIIKPSSEDSEVGGAIVQGDYTFIWAITENGFTDRDTVVYTVSLPIPSFFADQNHDTLIIVDDGIRKIDFNAFDPSPIKGTWTSSNSTLKFNGTNTNTSNNPQESLNLGVAYSYTSFYWTASDICTTTDTLVVGLAPKAEAGEDKLLCSNSVVLQGNIIAKTTVQWSMVGTDPSVIIEPEGVNANISSLKKGTYQFVYTITVSSVGVPDLINHDTVSVTVKDLEPITLISPNSTEFISFFPEYTLEAGGDNDTLLWLVDVPDAIITNPLGSKTLVSNLKENTEYFFELIDKDLVCISNTKSFGIEYKRVVNAGGDVEVCGNFVNLSGQFQIGMTYNWIGLPVGNYGSFIANQDGNNINFDDSTNPSTTANLIDTTKTGDYVLVLEMTDGIHSDYDTITVSFSKDVNLVFVADTLVTDNFVEVNVINKNDPTQILIGEWDILGESSFFTDFEDYEAQQTTLENIKFGAINIQWKLENGACDNFINVTMTRIPQAIITSIDTVYCEGDIISLEADTSEFKEGVKGMWLDATGQKLDSIPPYEFAGLPTQENILLIWETSIAVHAGVDGPVFDIFSNRDSIYVDIFPFEEANIPLDTLVTFSNDTLLEAISTIGGFWSSENVNIEFDDSQKTDAIVSKLPVGYTKLYWTTGTEDCESEDSIIVFRKIFVDAGDSIKNSCSPNIVLNGTPPIGLQTGKWTSTSTTVEIVDDSKFDTKITFKDVEEALFIWTVSENGFDFSDSVFVEVLELDTAYAGLDFSTNVDSVQVSAALGDISNVEWINNPIVPSSALIKNPFSVTTDITNLEEGINIFILLDNDIDCPSEDTLKIVYTDKQFIAKLDTATVNEDESIVVNISTNDIDLDKKIDFSTLKIITPPKQGLASEDKTTGEITYIPFPNFNGKDTLIYQLCSSINGCDTAYVIFTIDPMNDPFIALTDTIFLDEDNSITFDVSLNDFDIDGDLPDLTTLDTIIGASPAHGTIKIENNQFIYTPTENFFGKDSLIYKLCSTDKTCDTAYVKINIAPIDDPIIANLDQVEVSMNGEVTINVAVNDIDIDNVDDILSVSIFEMSNKGIAIVNTTNNHITYTPTEGLFGKDSLIYKICNQNNICDTAYLKINITEKIIIANLDTATVNEDESIVVNVSTNDLDVDNIFSELKVIQQPSHGIATANSTTREVTYTPNSNFNGKDSLIYEICSIDNICDTAYIIFTIKPMNDSFVAITDTIFVDEDQSITFDVSINDIDIDGDLFDFSKLDTIVGFGTTHGKVVIENNQFKYTPTENFFGKDSLIYELCSTDGTCDTAYVKINVLPIDDPIIANLDKVNVIMNGEVTFNVAANDIDIDDLIDTLSVKIFTPPDSGNAIVNAKGYITYTPKQDFFGKDSLVYEICNENNICDTAYLKITINEKLIANAGKDTTFCGLKTKLNAEAVTTSGYTAYWDIAEISGITINPNDPKTNVEFTTPGVYELVWVIENSSKIIESKDTIILTSIEEFDASIISNNGQDFSTDEVEISLTGNANGASIVKWTTNTSAKINDTTLVEIKITELELGENVFTFQTGDICPSDENITITYYNPFEANAGKDTVICNNSFVLEASPIPSDATGKWTSLLVDSNTILNSDLSTTQITNLPHKKIGYIWTVTNGFKTKSDTILIGVSLEDPIVNLINNVTIETEFTIDINPNKVDYNTYVYNVIEQKDSIIGTISINNDTDSLSYIVNKAALGYDTIIYTITDQCGRGIQDTISFFIQNSAPLEGDAFATAETGSVTKFNVLDSIYIFDNNYNINPNSFIFFDKYSEFGATAISLTNGNVSLDYSYVTKIGTDSLRYRICDDSSRCLEAYLKINVIPSEGVDEASVTVYNVISPNDDDKHDFLLIENLSNENGDPKYPNNRFTVFDRWGRIVTTIKGYDNYDNRWEGKNEGGDLVPQGTYYYAFQLNDDLFVSGFIIVNYE